MRLLTAVATLLASLALAQAPMKVGYQGLLLKSDGNPETGVQSITFKIYAASTGGTALWTETQSVALTQGFYSTYLGDVTALPTSLFDGTERFLEVSTGGVAMAPLMRIDSVPYAVSAGTARDLNGGLVNASSVQINGTTVIDSSGALAGNTAYTGATGVTVTGRTIGLPVCAAGEVLRYFGAPDNAWKCAPFTPPSSDGGVVAYTADTDGGLQLVGTGFTAFSLLRSCTAGQLLKWSPTVGWGCGDDNQGVTAVTAGTGISITGGTITTTGTISVAATVQNWAAQPNCGGGSYVQSISAAGVASCATDSTVTSVNASGGLTGTFSAGTLTLGTDGTTFQKRTAGAPLTCPGGLLRTVDAAGTSTCVSIGNAAGTVAAGDHLHTGTYLPIGSPLTCGGTDKVTGINANGSVICGTDQTSAGGDGIVGNEVTGATNATLARSGSGSSIDPYTLALNTGNANTWTATQAFGAGASVATGQTIDMQGVSSIRFNSSAATTTPMMMMFSGGIGNGLRPVIGHSPSYPDYGLLYEDATDTFKFQPGASFNPTLYVSLGTERVGIGTASTPAAKLEVTGTPSGVPTIKTDGHIRMGTETGTTEAPRLDFGYQGMVVRRINSSNAIGNSNTIARDDVLALRRVAGTSAGFELARLNAASSGQRGYAACQGVTTGGTPVGVAINSPAGDVSPATYPLFTDAQGVMMMTCQFGTLDASAFNRMWHHTTVTLARTNTGHFWAGTLTSTYNQ